ncbi:hypothetical protein PAAG_12119 [Paracoccidioides lutzii Pb01]|uniref:Uncharacterized protein n=1 Tax=Paracoccidioides lutzii (strain ATCC MYA-826 / Pb01) TaxID=502779 RepID=A0A0A2V4Z7_PARBA|nr:hypothetical protein PAAG_12119 [Paracoccidioides lutzii Pb01]KGQ01175.1 hypothetical protein PAAG_12119 [Paracoccidioides lutzii Pb01]
MAKTIWSGHPLASIDVLRVVESETILNIPSADTARAPRAQGKSSEAEVHAPSGLDDNVIPHRAGHQFKISSNLTTHPFQRAIMPSIHNKKTSNSLEQEGRLELAINAIKKQEISSISRSCKAI